MPLPPDEAARLLWVQAYMAGSRAEWERTAQAMRDLLRLGPALFESDASAAFDRRREAQRPREAD